MSSMAGKRPWGAGVFAATAVAALALLAAKAAVTSAHPGPATAGPAVHALAYPTFAHVTHRLRGWLPDPGRSDGATTAAVAVVGIVLLTTVSLRRVRVPRAGSRSSHRVRGPPATRR